MNLKLLSSCPQHCELPSFAFGAACSFVHSPSLRVVSWNCSVNCPTGRNKNPQESRIRFLNWRHPKSRNINVRNSNAMGICVHRNMHRKTFSQPLRLRLHSFGCIQGPPPPTRKLKAAETPFCNCSRKDAINQKAKLQLWLISRQTRSRSDLCDVSDSRSRTKQWRKSYPAVIVAALPRRSPGKTPHFFDQKFNMGWHVQIRGSEWILHNTNS